MVSSSVREVQLTYQVPFWSPDWAVPEVPVPESDVHDSAIEYIRALLNWWLSSEQPQDYVARNLAIRWYPDEPRAGFDPDLCWLSPPPADQPLQSLRLWEVNHHPPRLAIEVVSPSHPYKDYLDTPDRCAACGIGELWIYDPLQVGPKRQGGPWLLQVWQAEAGRLRRVHAGAGPAFSRALNAWLHPVASAVASDAKLRIGSKDGLSLWQSEAEDLRARAEREAEQRRRLEAELERLKRRRE